MSTVLELRGLCVEFPTRRGTLKALNEVSFSINAGEVVGVVGESGAGKSLTGAAIIGLLEPPGRISGGEVLLDGERIDTLSDDQMRHIRGRRIGAIFQDPLTSLNPLYTVGRQIAETIVTHLPLTWSQARERAIELLESTGIPAARARIDHYPHQFSGGMRQRVVIALALAAEIEITDPQLAANEDGYVLAADFAFDLNERLEDAVAKGLILHFVADFEMTRPRWYWLDEKLVTRSQTYRLSYHALTRQYRLSTGGLHQSFDSLSGALRVLSRLRNWQVIDSKGAEKAGVRVGDSYTAALRFRLDINHAADAMRRVHHEIALLEGIFLRLGGRLLRLGHIV